jgi:hypothetical protein
MHERRLGTGPAAIMVLAAAMATAGADTLALRDGGLLEGRYDGGTADVVQFSVGGQQRYYPVNVIAQLVLSAREAATGVAPGSGASPEAGAPPEPIATEGTVTLRLRDGSVFKGSYRGGTGDLAWFQALGVVKGFPIGTVAAIEFVPPPPAPAAAPPAPAVAPTAAAAPPPEAPASAPPPGPKKTFFGGGFGFGYGDLSWVEIWPVLGYRVSKSITAGVEGLYRVREDDRTANDITATDYGVSPFVRVNLARGLFIQAEYEFLSYEYVDTSLGTDRDTYDSFLMGVGLSRPMGGHAAFVVSAFYNFSWSDDELYSPYDEAWTVNAGVGFGF